MNDVIPMSSDTVTVKMPRYLFDRDMTNRLGGYCSGVTLQLRKEGGVSVFFLRTRPATYLTEEHIIGEWQNGKGTLCNKAVAKFAR